MTSESSAMTALSATNGRTFSLATLLLVMTVFSLWLCCLMLDRALAALVCVPLAFAAFRTHRAINVRARSGRSTPSGRKVKVFVASFYLGIVICLLCAVVAAISFAFLSACEHFLLKYAEIPNFHAFWPVLLGFVGMVFSVLAAQITTVSFIWSTWPKRSDAANEELY